MSYVFKVNVIGYHEYIEIKADTMNAAIEAYKRLFADLTDVEAIFQQVECDELEVKP